MKQNWFFSEFIPATVFIFLKCALLFSFEEEKRMNKNDVIPFSKPVKEKRQNLQHSQAHKRDWFSLLDNKLSNFI